MIADGSSAKSPACDGFRFDRSEWTQRRARSGGGQSPREEVAELLVECGTLIGRPTAQVREMLRPGGTSPGARSASYLVGGSYGIFGEPMQLIVESRDHRVRAASLAVG